MTQPINSANTDKTNSSELPQPIHTVSIIEAAAQDIKPISDTSNSDPLSSQFSSPTPSQSANSFSNPLQGSVSNFERLLSQAQWNNSFDIVNSSSLSFQSSLPLRFGGTPPIITVSSNSPTPDPD